MSCVVSDIFAISFGSYVMSRLSCRRWFGVVTLIARFMGPNEFQLIRRSHKCMMHLLSFLNDFLANRNTKKLMFFYVTTIFVTYTNDISLNFWLICHTLKSWNTRRLPSSVIYTYNDMQYISYHSYGFSMRRIFTSLHTYIRINILYSCSESWFSL